MCVLSNLKPEQIIRVCQVCQLPPVPVGMYPSHGWCKECFVKSEYGKLFTEEEINEMNDFVNTKEGK